MVALLPGRAAGAMACYGDCDGDGFLTVDELVRAVTIALGRQTIDTCLSADVSGDEMVTVEEVIVATQFALRGCPPPDTATATATDTPVHTGTPTVTATRTLTATRTRTPTHTPLASPTITPTGDRPPELTCREVYRTYPTLPIDFQIDAFDPNGGAVTFAAANLPEGASLDTAGRFQWTPSETQTGAFHIRFTATDESDLSADGELMFKVLPPDDCIVPTCSPASGCESPLIGFDQLCCLQGARQRVAEPFAGCPQGRVLFVGRPGADYFQRANNCDAITYYNQFQTGAYIIFDLEARCLRADRDIRAQIRMFNATRVGLDEDIMLQFNPIENGFLFAPDVYFEVRGGGPFFDLDGGENNMIITLTDADGVSVTGEFRIVTIQGGLSMLPDPDSSVLPPEPGPCNIIQPPPEP